MHDEYKFTLLKFAASNIKTNTNIQRYYEDIFKIQEIYSQSSDVVSHFCPIQFFASNIHNILKMNSVCIEFDKYSKIPIKITLNNLILFTQFRMNNLHVTMLYLQYFEKFESIFNEKAYYSQYYELINLKYKSSKLDKYTLASLFFVEYGYWNQLHLNYIHPLQYICSYPEFIKIYEDDILKHLFKFNNDEKLNLIFDPYVYIASNIEQLFYLVENESYIPNSNNEIRIYKQYIRDGFNKKIKINAFDHYGYLANNPKEIKNIMTEGSCVYWDVYRLSKRNISLNYINNFKKSKTNTFDAAKFVEENVSDIEVNFDKKLSIETAPMFFVLNYVKYKKLRYHMSKRYSLGVFLSQCIKDSLRTLPLSIIKCFYTVPI